jgi:hypothetical protein
MVNRPHTRFWVPCILFSVIAVHGWAGSIFLTGHDPDYHAYAGFNNSLGAQHIDQAAISFILDSASNPFAASGIHEFLFVEGGVAPPNGHVDGESGLIAAGFRPGIDFETHNASDLSAQLDLLGTKYSGIVVGSDFGGISTQSELDILNARNGTIISFLNSGGGLFAMAETPPPDGLASTGLYGFLPFLVSSVVPREQAETGNTLTPFGLGLGLTESDINGNYSHNVFSATGGLTVVDTDPAGEILSMAGRGEVSATTGLVPEPRSIGLLAAGMLFVCGFCAVPSARLLARRRPRQIRIHGS